MCDVLWGSRDVWQREGWKLAKIACNFMDAPYKRAFESGAEKGKRKKLMKTIYIARQKKVISCCIWLISQQRIWIFIRKFTRLFYSHIYIICRYDYIWQYNIIWQLYYNCQIILYCHTIWLSYAIWNWTETTPRFITWEFYVCAIYCSIYYLKKMSTSLKATSSVTLQRMQIHLQTNV